MRRLSSAVVRTESGPLRPQSQKLGLVLLRARYGHKTRWIYRAAESLFSVLFPSDCRICGLPLLNISRLPVCPDCLAAIEPIQGNICSICGERVLSSYAICDDEGICRCPVCRRIDRPFERAVAYGSYDGGLRELVHLLKFNGVRPAADVLGRMLAEAIAQFEPSSHRTASGKVIVTWLYPCHFIAESVGSADSIRRRWLHVQRSGCLRAAIGYNSRLISCFAPARPTRRSASPAINVGRICVGPFRSPVPRKSLATKCFSWMMSIRPERRRRNALGCCAAPAWPRYG